MPVPRRKRRGRHADERDRADCAFPLSGLAKIRITGDPYLRRGRSDCAFTPSGLAKIFGDDAGVASRHWLIFGDRLYQRSIRSEEFIPIIAVGVVEQFPQCLRRKGMCLVHARNVILHG
jgi:hypothetical protein